MDKSSLIRTPIEQELVDFEELFDSSLTNSNPLLNEVLLHLKKGKGKMMRPILVLLIAKLFGKVSKSTLHAAVALELLHTASLVHDDVVDESTKRRGQLSANAIYNNKIAVLVGDYILATCLVQANLSSDSEIVSVVAHLGQDLSEGEVLQLSNVSNAEISEGVYFDVIRKKTAALFAACTEAAAISAKASAEQVEKARLFGEYIGICFQIKDDIFDYYESEELGKPTGNDMLEGKLTLPAIHVLTSKQNAEADNWAARVKTSEATQEEISLLIEYIKQNGGIEYAKKVMYDYKQKALDLIADVDDADIKAALAEYLNYVVDRVK